MTADELAEIGMRLEGARWQRALAARVGVNERTMRRWAAGDQPVPPAVAKLLIEWAARLNRDAALEQIDRLIADQGGNAPIEIALTEGRGEIGRRATEVVAEALRARGLAVTITPIAGDLTDPARRALAAAHAAKEKA